MAEVSMFYAVVKTIKQFSARGSIGLDITLEDRYDNSGCDTGRTCYYQLTLYDDAARRALLTLHENDQINVKGKQVIDMILPKGENYKLLRQYGIKIPRPVIIHPIYIYNFTRSIDVLKCDIGKYAESANAVSVYAEPTDEKPVDNHDITTRDEDEYDGPFC